MGRQWIRRFWFFPPVLIGLAALFLTPLIKSPPQKAESVERAVKVRAIKAPEIAVVSRVVGYGACIPGRTWEAVAEVSGQVVWLSERLKGGHIVAQGTELLRIDDSYYMLALTQARTQLDAMDVKDRTVKALLAVEERNQALLTQDAERKRKLNAQGVLSASEFEETKRLVLRGEATLQNLKNSLALNAAERRVLMIQQAAAELDLRRTVLTAPFDVRLTEVKITQAQYANKGQLLFSADGIRSVEVEARFPIGKGRHLIAGETVAEASENFGPEAEHAPWATKLEAVVRLQTATHTVEWEAKVDRVAGLIDPQTQTMGVVVVVDDPYGKARPGQRPPLVRNTFVEVELRKKPQGKSVVIPASALHEGRVYIADRNNRLEIRPVRTAFIQGGAAVVADGIEADEWVVVSDIIPPQKGMLLGIQEDAKTVKQLVAETGGRKGSGK
ncbi:MAG: efflux RND transporter periplasmic adaptor subunit [Proteobacteria bacterium]|nr:efflux RND transporter periplasmic adaptor subunit [Pseudomonadota bacterium]